ncbi:hypothetical protein C2G38_2175205 [Gigaspora rosea]|uniref:Uncharacterized protein n=1 Tax=Gigaspora rosea TaxID=44941 RepID=A0A397VIZ1_9GLOM|nr:hypothetical protein C2G38_2175205 [Gigaspora rosea]
MTTNDRFCDSDFNNEFYDNTNDDDLSTRRKTQTKPQTSIMISTATPKTISKIYNEIISKKKSVLELEMLSSSCIDGTNDGDSNSSNDDSNNGSHNDSKDLH